MSLFERVCRALRSESFASSLGPLVMQQVPEHPPVKRRFRVRQDGWVRHDGGMCPLPDKVRVAIIYRGVSSILEDRSDRVPEQWWTQQDGKYDVLWFRVLESWQERQPAAWA